MQGDIPLLQTKPYARESRAASSLRPRKSRAYEGWATSGSGKREAVGRRPRVRRTTEAPQRWHIHTETGQRTPRFQTRGPRRCRRII